MATPPDQDLEDLRREVDRLDGAMVDLLAERMRVVRAIAAIKRVAALDGQPAIRPGREAVILRRIARRAAGRFPAGALVRMWRELLAATTRSQAPLAVAAFVPPDQPELWDIARDHFGSLTPVQRAGGWSQALRLLADGAAQLAVLPLPRDGEPWWASLLNRPARPLRVVARLPFGGLAGAYPEGSGGLVVGTFDPDASGADVTLVAAETPGEVGHARLLDLLAGAGLESRWLATQRQPEGGAALHLIELDGFLAPDDSRVAAAWRASPGHVLRGAPLGGYARPLAAGE
jgi:chorismate mutase / prephenate dehydratase